MINKFQAIVLNSIKAARKATYSQATAEAGNGRTVGALIEKKLVSVNPATAKQKETTYSLTAEGTAALKEWTKAQPKAAAPALA